MDSSSDQTSGKKSYFFKVILLGNPSTGKTSFIKQYVHAFYTRAYVCTIGVDFASKTINYDDSTVVKYHLWDIPGQDSFVCLTGPVFRGAHGALLLFDMSKPKTRESTLFWKAELDKRSTREDGSTLPCLLLANKCDLVEGMSKDEEEALKTFARVNGFTGCIVASVKYGICIDEAMRVLTEAMIERENNASSSGKKEQNDIIKLSKKSQQSSSQGCCC